MRQRLASQGVPTNKEQVYLDSCGWHQSAGLTAGEQDSVSAYKKVKNPI